MKRETEDTEKYTLIFEDEVYSHKLTIKCEEDTYDKYDVGDHLDSNEILRQSTLKESGGG